MSTTLIERLEAIVATGEVSRAGLARAAGLHPNSLRKLGAADWNPTADTLKRLEKLIQRGTTEVLVSTEAIIDEARNGRMFILVDDDDRENEGDLIIPGQMATPDAINFMARHGRGLICLALTKERSEQLALEPEPALLELVRLLREGAPLVAAARGREDEDVATLDTVPVSRSEPDASEGDGTAVAANVEPTLPMPVPTRGSHLRNALGRRPLLLGALALAALVFTVWRSARERPALPPAPPPALEQKVVVTPFRGSGASASLAYLREGIVELLSARLADDSSARSVDAGAVLAAWRAAGLADVADVRQDTILALARRLGAERVVIGSVVGSVRRVVVAATVLDTETGLAAGSATIEVPPDSVGQLVDALAARLLLIESGEDASLAARTTGSLRALRAFLRAQAAFRRGEYVTAVAGYEDALRADSTFALASLQLARSADRLGSVEQSTGALVTTWRERASLDARLRPQEVAQDAARFRAPSDGPAL
jgi:TolB-like protein